MNFKVGDKVVVISGKDKGSEGKIIKTLNLKMQRPRVFASFYFSLFCF